MTPLSRTSTAQARRRCWRRIVSALLACALTAAGPGSWTAARAQSKLPALGDTDSADFTVGTERKIGDDIMRQIRVDPDYVDDPLLLEYLETVWQPLVAASRSLGNITADLDQRFAWRVARWPEVGAGLLDQMFRRVQRLSFHVAILENPHVEVRLVLLFWHLADRWGHVGPEGVTIPLRLTHQALGRLVRAQRPSVTASLRRLAERGLICRDDAGFWLLRGNVAEHLAVLATGERRLGSVLSSPLPPRLPDPD